MRSRDVWRTEYVVDHADTTDFSGDSWPIVWAEKWEVNGIGERRFIERRDYRPTN